MRTLNGRIRVTVNVVNIPLYVFLQEANADPQRSYPSDGERGRKGSLPGHRAQLSHREERRRETCAEARPTAQPRDGENAAQGKDDVPQYVWSVSSDASPHIIIVAPVTARLLATLEGLSPTAQVGRYQWASLLRYLRILLCWLQQVATTISSRFLLGNYIV